MSVPRRFSRATLTGSTVRLRPVVPGDAGRAFHLIHEREAILRWLIWSGPRTREELEETFAAWSGPLPGGRERTGYLFAIDELEAEEFVGTIGLRFFDDPHDADVGYWLAEPAWGKGYGTEAIELVSHFAFRHLDSHSMSAWVFVGNVASRRILEKNGFVLARTVKDKVERDGVKRDEWLFVLPRSSWERDREHRAPPLEDVDGPAPGRE